jgi:hypothetical protein
MKLRLRHVTALAALLAALASPDEARACGGCFVPPTESTVVTGHRMAISISPVQSVLWDQIRYAGEPADFAWVLPVRSGARIEVATDAWFETLEAGTAVSVVGPSPNCGSGLGCGAQADAASLAEGDALGGGVTVLHQGTVGPYSTVTLHSEDPAALYDWLNDNGYSVPDDLAPTIDAYVDEGFDFIAIKLLPGKGVSQMRPVRVVTPGAGVTLPLRMIAAGSGAEVALVLYIIGEGRWESANFPNVRVSDLTLTWDYLTNESSYGTLRDTLLRQGGGSWLTAYAQKGALLSPVLNPVFGFDVQYGAGATFVDTLSEAYFAQALANGEASEACSGDFAEQAFSGIEVVNPCPEGERLDSEACGDTFLTGDARTFVCGKGDQDGVGLADDLAIALTGLHPKDVWLTRLEAELPRSALGRDLDLGPADDQEAVTNWLQARIGLHEEEFCGSSMVQPVLPRGGDAGGRRTGGLVGLGAVGLALAAWLSRRAPALPLASARRSGR